MWPSIAFFVMGLFDGGLWHWRLRRLNAYDDPQDYIDPLTGHRSTSAYYRERQNCLRWLASAPFLIVAGILLALGRHGT